MPLRRKANRMSARMLSSRNLQGAGQGPSHKLSVVINRSAS